MIFSHPRIFSVTEPSLEGPTDQEVFRLYSEEGKPIFAITPILKECGFLRLDGSPSKNSSGRYARWTGSARRRGKTAGRRCDFQKGVMEKISPILVNIRPPEERRKR